VKVDDAMRARLTRVKLLVCDVDGTLTDGAMWYGPDGEALKRFSTRDGHGIGMLHDAGIAVAFVTTENSPIVTARATKLRVAHVVLGCTDKSAAVRELRVDLGLERDEVAMIGDDLGDLPGFKESGIAVAVGDAVAEVSARADLVCEQHGGRGAVRELADAILAHVGTAGAAAPGTGPDRF
jgi:3-deoxy-D-manno-octulosonate 8-phosphate phosphatase (KDO 8-P phosphatase)